jgi:hypothetical protein
MAEKKAKKEETLTQTVPVALWKFLVKQAGGEEALYGQFYKAQLQGMFARGWSWGKISAKAEEAGWGAWLLKQSPADLQGVAKAKPAARKAAAKKTGAKRRRLGAAEMEKLQAQVAADVAKNPGSKIGEIAGRTGTDKAVLGKVLQALLEAKTLKGVGERGQRVYSAAGKAAK